MRTPLRRQGGLELANLVTNYTKNIALDAVTDRTIQVRPHTSDPGSAGTTGQYNSNGISNVDVTAANWTAASGAVVDNSTLLDFGDYTGTTDVTINHFSLWDGTNHMYNVELTSPKTLSTGDALQASIGELNLTA